MDELTEPVVVICLVASLLVQTADCCTEGMCVRVLISLLVSDSVPVPSVNSVGIVSDSGGFCDTLANSSARK